MFAEITPSELRTQAGQKLQTEQAELAYYLYAQAVLRDLAIAIPEAQKFQEHAAELEAEAQTALESAELHRRSVRAEIVLAGEASEAQQAAADAAGLESGEQSALALTARNRTAAATEKLRKLTALRSTLAQVQKPETPLLKSMAELIR